MNSRNLVRIDKALILLCDILAILIAFFLALFLCIASGLLELNASFEVWMQRAGLLRTVHFLWIVPVIIASFWVRGHYTRRRPSADEWLDIVKTVVFAAAVELLLSFMLKWYFSRAWFVLTWAIALPVIPIVRYWIKRRLLKSGRWIDNTLIIGTGENARDSAWMLEAEPLCGFRIVAFMEPPEDWEQVTTEMSLPALISVNGREIPVLRNVEDSSQVIKDWDIHHTVVALDSPDMWQANKLIFDSNWSQSSLNIAPNLRGIPMVGVELLHFFSQELLLLHLRNNLARRMPQRIKRLFDILLSGLLMVILAPVFLTCAIVIGVRGDPVFFGQQRVGRFGRVFTVHKFRTMVVDAEQQLAAILAADPASQREWDMYCKLTDDPRITPLGQFLRRTSIDELPQLWNVLKGEMSLVGPRPVEAVDLERYGENAAYYEQLRPGISGLWQISGRSDTDFEARIHMDTWYARNWTLWYDMFILIKTIFVVFGGRGSR